jgi:signal transduction histidine kinase
MEKPNADKDQVTGAPDNTPCNRVRPLSFPWPTALGGLLIVSYLVLMTEPALIRFYDIPALWFPENIRLPLLGVFMLLVLLDLRSYRRELADQKADLQRLRQQASELWDSRKQLQLKAHTYSGHADKLKMFISDKLLEYIEYDEKFLHFKSIAAEVRHNGVISFDKVQTALQGAVDGVKGDAGADPQKTQDLQAALDAMRYLWDLLDLSTADNLALHIGNLLCECEEHYYQRMLNIETADAALPYDPVYPPQRGAWRALSQVCHDRLPAREEGKTYYLDDGQWYVQLAPVSDLLGNENHLVLLLENLLKNAQFFSRKRGFTSPFAPVALILEEQQGQVRLRVYNRGPHIRGEDRQNLFQLGFSTRRAREHHGRGLGLYFVNEIVKGYEGQIRVHNIQTPEARYAIRIELVSDEVFTELLDVIIEDGKPLCRTNGGERKATGNWTFSAPLRSVEVTTTGSEKTQQLRGFADKGRQSRFDPGNPEHPQWRLTYQPKRGSCQLSFEPLDITGVEFEIRLPTARLRLDSSELALEGDIDSEVERLDEQFRAPGTP